MEFARELGVDYIQLSTALHPTETDVPPEAMLDPVANTLDLPARQSFVVQIVGRNDLINAIALNSAVFNGARVVGPAVAGLLVARYGVAIAFLMNGLSFLGVIAALLAIHNEGEPRPRSGDSLAQEILQGLGYAWATPLIMLILAYMLVTSLFVVNFGVVVLLVARDVLHEHPLVVHLVDVITGNHDQVLGAVTVDDVDVLEHGIGGADVPLIG